MVHPEMIFKDFRLLRLGQDLDRADQIELVTEGKAKLLVAEQRNRVGCVGDHFVDLPVLGRVVGGGRGGVRRGLP